MGTATFLFHLLRNEICRTELPDNLSVSDSEAEQLYYISQKHDLSHLTGDALLRNGLIKDAKIADRFKRQILMSVYRYEQQSAEFERICKIFYENQIKFVPLKGTIIKTFYPEPWMRTSCDIDILVREDDLQKATDALIKNGFETDGKKNYHDISFFSGNVHLELHFNICEDNIQLDKLLEKVWDFTYEVGQYQYRETNEFFAFHHIAHMAYHFLSGGCGIRPFLDLWIMRRKSFYDENKLLLLLKECDLIKFYNNCVLLSEVWFEDGKHNDVTVKMHDYILKGGVYGDSDNANAVGIITNKGKVRYLLRIAFPPFKTMCILYPILKKYKFLLPFCYVSRFFSKIFGKTKVRAKNRINNTVMQSNKDVTSLDALLTDLDLNR